MPSDGATDCMAPNWPIELPRVGSRNTATRVVRGATSLSNSTHFALRPNSYSVNPVALPPGRARLATKPEATGSVTCTNTTGIVRVICNSGVTVEVATPRMTSGASAITSAICWRVSSASPALPHR